MRKTLLLIFLSVGAFACKKSEPVSPGLFGKWEIRSRYGSISGFDSTYKAGNGTILQFNSDSTYNYYTKRKLSSNGIFHIKTLPGINAALNIYFDNAEYGQPFSYNGTKMTIGADFDDGVAAEYEKIAN